MERQILPVDSREAYVYLPAERDDKAIETGRQKYLPIDPCQAYGIGCNNKTTYLKISRQKRSLLTSEGTKNDKKQIDNSSGSFLTKTVENSCQAYLQLEKATYLQLDNATYLQLDNATYLQLVNATYL